MKTDKNSKPDKDCIVLLLGAEDYYACRSIDPDKNECPYMTEYHFCNYPDRHNLPQSNYNGSDYVESTIYQENCFVHQLDESNCFVCLAEEQAKDTCPHASDFGFQEVFCAHPDRDEFSRKRLPEDHLRHPDKDFPPGNN